MRAAHLSRLQVPGDLSVLGFDGIALGEDLTPALATITQPHRDVGPRSVELLRESCAAAPLDYCHLSAHAATDGALQQVAVNATTAVVSQIVSCSLVPRRIVFRLRLTHGMGTQ
jgi:hypothetical protein